MKKNVCRLRISCYSLILLCGIILLGACSMAPRQANELSPISGYCKNKAETIRKSFSHTSNDALTKNLVACCDFNNNLLSLNNTSLEKKIVFNRNSIAYLPDGTKTAFNQPRYLPGKYGAGLLIEAGQCACGVEFGKNLLPPDFLENSIVKLPGTSVTPVSNMPNERGVKIITTRAASGIKLYKLKVDTGKLNAFSVFLKSNKKQQVTIAVNSAISNKDLGEKTFTITPAYKRCWVTFKLQKDKKQAKQAINILITSKTSGQLHADRFMLESFAGYVGSKAPTTWMPPGKTRAGEIVHPILFPSNTNQGTIAFWTKLLPKLQWRTLLTFGTGNNGWNPKMRLDIKNDQIISLNLPDKKGKKFTYKTTLTGWHHFTVTWENRDIQLYLDGKRVIEIPDALNFTTQDLVTLGGVHNNASPGIRANAIFDEFSYWNKVLSAKDISSLEALKTPLSSRLKNKITIETLQPISTFARDEQINNWSLYVKNNSDKTLKNEYIIYGIDKVFKKKLSLPEIPAGYKLKCNLPWSPEHIMPGNYSFKYNLFLKNKKKILSISQNIEITPARYPARNAQIIAWGDGSNTRKMHDAGITVGGINGCNARDVEETIKNSMYVNSLQFLLVKDAENNHKMMNAIGKYGMADYANPEIKKELVKKADLMAKKVSKFPDVRYIIINSEHQSTGNMDFRPKTISEVKQRFKLDLNQWIPKNKKTSYATVHPEGRLSQAYSKTPVPKDYIISPENNFYAYHRYWHSNKSGTEVTCNELIIKEVNKYAPLIKTIIEPILRAPYVQAYKLQDISEEWFYYPNPTVAVWIQERLQAKTRGTIKSSISGMPQFLFKPGMAAPYGGMPTPHLYREAMWLCIARPLNNFMYWNLQNALIKNQKKETKEQNEIDIMFGKKPSYQEVKSKISRQGEYSSVFLWIPELPVEISRMHHKIVQPLGALLPKWHNKQRQLAIYLSFAGSLYNNIRWQGNSPLSRLIRSTTIPYDVIFDQDFERNKNLLNTYKVVVIPESPVLYAPAQKQLTAFISKGGSVVVGPKFKAQLPGAIKIEATLESKTDVKKYNAKANELLKLYLKTDNPQFIEGMQEFARSTNKNTESKNKVWYKILKKVNYPVKVESNDVFLNLLEYGKANYFVAVNDRRIPGKYYGHFGKVREQGLKQTVKITVDKNFGNTAYELLTCKEIKLTSSKKKNELKLELPPCGGKIVLFLPEAIKKLTGKYIRKKDSITLSASLTGKTAIIPGIIPAKITIIKPDGQESDFSHYTAFKNGELSFKYPIALNHLKGKYLMKVKELASGKEITLICKL